MPFTGPQQRQLLHKSAHNGLGKNPCLPETEHTKANQNWVNHFHSLGGGAGMTFWWAMVCQEKEARKGFLKPHKWASGRRGTSKVPANTHLCTLQKAADHLATLPPFQDLPFLPPPPPIRLPTWQWAGQHREVTIPQDAATNARLPQGTKSQEEGAQLNGGRMENEEVQKDKRLSSQSIQVWTLVFSY